MALFARSLPSWVPVVLLIVVVVLLAAPSSLAVQPGRLDRTADSPAAPAGPDWVPLSSPNHQSPPAAAGAATAYDPLDGYVVRFGGCVSGNYWYSTCTPTNATWILDPSGNWTQLHPALSPPARYYASLTYDAADGYLLLFGGNSSNGFLNDTWSFVHGAWTNQTGVNASYPNAPPARAAAALAYDAYDGYVLLYGGEQSRQLVNATSETYVGSDFTDTWSYRGGGWVPLSPAQDPGALDSASCAFDAATASVVLYGGFSWNGGNSGATWMFHGGQWTELPAAGNSSASPPGRNNGALTFDPQIPGLVLFGGHAQWEFYTDTWEFVNGSWSPVAFSANATVPSGAFGSNLVWDNATSQLLLMGGYLPVTSDEGLPGSASLSGNYTAETWSLVNLTSGSPTTGGGGGTGGSGGGTSGGGGGNSSGNGTGPGGTPSAPLNVTARVLSSSGGVPFSVTFTLTISGGTAPYTIQWSFGDGGFGSEIAGAPVHHLYTLVGVFDPKVTVVDGSGAARSTELAPVVVHAPSPPASVPVNGLALVYTGAAAALLLMASTALFLHRRSEEHQRLAQEGARLVRQLKERGPLP
jgi:hypothetical protein